MSEPEPAEGPKVERWDGWLREMAPSGVFWKRLEREPQRDPDAEGPGR